jgi:hypothetical protein
MDPNSSFNFNVNPEIRIIKKIKNSIYSYQLNLHMQRQINSSILSYRMPGIDEVKLTTYLKVQLNEYNEGEKIKFKR